MAGRSVHTLELFNHFVQAFHTIGPVECLPAKTMIGIATQRKRIAWVTQLGKNFVHVVFPFNQPYPDNLCFIKIARVPGERQQFNHHLRIYDKSDLNEEVITYMKLAFEKGQ